MAHLLTTCHNGPRATRNKKSICFKNKLSRIHELSTNLRNNLYSNCVHVTIHFENFRLDDKLSYFYVANIWAAQLPSQLQAPILKTIRSATFAARFTRIQREWNISAWSSDRRFWCWWNTIELTAWCKLLLAADNQGDLPHKKLTSHKSVVKQNNNEHRERCYFRILDGSQSHYSGHHWHPVLHWHSNSTTTKLVGGQFFSICCSGHQ